MKRKEGYSTALDATEVKRRQDAKKDRRDKAIQRNGIKEELRRKDEAVHGTPDAGSIFQQMNQSSVEKDRERQNVLEKEREKLAREAAEAARARKVFICGDAQGSFAKLFSTVEAQHKKVGPFDVLLCVGSFLPESGSAEEHAGVSAYFKGEQQVPLDCYFVDPGAVMLQAAPRGKRMCDNLFFLGAFGVREIHGLRVAFLSGHYDPAVFHTVDADFIGGAFTAKAICELQKLVNKDKQQRGIDVLLTCGWPAGCDQNIEDDAQRPPILGNDPSRQSFCAPPLAELCLAIEPRYHIFGSANLFYQRPPFQTNRRKHACRCIGLGKVGSTSKQQKWLHALQLSPMAHMKRSDLMLMPASITPCPFNETQEQPPGAPTQQVNAAMQVETQGIPEQAVVFLLQGDLNTYLDLAAKLKHSPFTCRAPAAEARNAEEGPVAEEGAAAPSSSSTSDPKKAQETDPKKKAAEQWLEKDPKQGVVRFTFKDSSPLGLRLSKDMPPWVLEVKDGLLGARKAPRVPLGGIVIAINGYKLTEENCQEVTKALALRPVILDIQWPEDQLLPGAKYA